MDHLIRPLPPFDPWAMFILLQCSKQKTDTTLILVNPHYWSVSWIQYYSAFEVLCQRRKAWMKNEKKYVIVLPVENAKLLPYWSLMFCTWSLLLTNGHALLSFFISVYSMYRKCFTHVSHYCHHVLYPILTSLSQFVSMISSLQRLFAAASLCCAWNAPQMEHLEHFQN